jgi:hypothetical protein
MNKPLPIRPPSGDEVCRRLMTVPGVGPVVALTYRATVDVPARSARWRQDDHARQIGRGRASIRMRPQQTLTSESGTIKFEARLKDLVDNFPDLVTLVQPLPVVRRVLREQISILHRRVLAVVRDPPCRP